ncbi:helicase-related protein, partial [Caldivirga sp.]|uniref:helicase-related protein n=1 Tax=Caldivirga sp. TaxID=2080243 RepID=UPI003D126338
SATPHRGKNDDYLARLYLLDNYLIRDKRLENDYEFYRLTHNAIVFRRIKDHVNKIYEEHNIFSNAMLHVYLIEPTNDELMYYKELDELTRNILRDYYDKINEEGKVIPLLAALIDKRGLSSPLAGLKTLKTIISKRASVLKAKITVDDIKAYLEDEELGIDNDETVNSILTKYANILENYRGSIMKVIEYAERALNSDSRFKAVLSLINSHVGNRDSIIIFTEYRDTANYVYEKLINERVNADVRKLTGDDLQGNPNAINEVKNWLQGCRNEGKSCVLVSTDVAAEGLNLQAANVVINYEVPWTPLKIEQRVGRVWRLGQDRDVTAYIVALASVFEKAIFDILFTKLFAEISARVEVKTPELVTFSTVNNKNKVVYDLTKYEGDLASAVEIERKKKGKTVNESLTPYTLWRIYKFEGEEGLNDVVKSVIARVRELRDHYRKLGLSAEKAPLQDILPTLVGFRNRRELTEAVNLVIREMVKKLGGNYDEESRIITYNGRRWTIRNTPIDLLKVLWQILNEIHNPTVLKYVLCTGYDKTIQVYRACVKINPSTQYCTLVPVVNGEIKTVHELLNEISSIIKAGCMPADDSNLDDSLRIKVKDHVLGKGVYMVVNPLEDYINKSVEMKVRERSNDWLPVRSDQVNDKVDV